MAGLVALILSCFTVQAAPILLYGMTFTPDQFDCCVGCQDYPANGGHFFNISPGAETIIDSGDWIEVQTDPNCCSSSQVPVGWVNVYSSGDGGAHWTLVTANIPVWQPGGTCDNRWQLSQNPSNGAVSSSVAHTLRNCSQQQ